MEPMRAQPTYQPSIMSVRANWLLTIAVVPEMTAVSYPKRMPPMAATTAMKITYPSEFFCFIISLLEILHFVQDDRRNG